MYPDTQLHIDGAWTDAAGGETLAVINPATEEMLGQVAHARVADLDRALPAAERGFREWKTVSAFDRHQALRQDAAPRRARATTHARPLPIEPGPPAGEDHER